MYHYLYRPTVTTVCIPGGGREMYEYLPKTGMKGRDK